MLSVGVSGVAADPPELSQEIQRHLDAHRAGRAHIKAFDAELVTRHKSLIGPKAGTPEIVTGIWRWSKRGAVDRLRSKDFLEPKATLHGSAAGKIRCADLLRSGDEIRALDGWNPDDPPRLSIANQRGVMAWVQPQTGIFQGSAGDSANILLWEMRCTNVPNDTRKSLDELARVSAAVESLPRDKGLVGLSFRPNAAGDPLRAPRIDVFLDPRQGFMIKRIVEHYPNYPWRSADGKGEVVNVTWRREVTETKEFGDGVYFPIETQIRFMREGRAEPTAISRATVTRAIVNKTLPHDALDFRFPENALVRYPSAAGKHPVKVWGPDNLPLRDYESIGTIERQLAAIGIEPSQLSAGWRFGAALGCLGVAGVIAVLFVRHWRRRRAV